VSSTEPDLRARIRQAIRNEAETHSCLYQEGIDVDEMTARVMAVIGGEQPPPVVVTINPEITTLTAKLLTHWAPACPSGRHVAHPGYDCDEQDALAEAWGKTWGKWLAAGKKAQHRGTVSPALRGPNYPAPAPDPAPLRAIAEQALAEGSALPGVRPYSEVKVTTGRAPDALAPDPGPFTTEGLYDQLMAVFGVPLPPPALAPKGSCPCGGGDFDGESIHAPECPIHPVRLKWAAEAATALLPEEARAAGLHFEYDTTEPTS
jgi:hypothetical protein